MGQDRRWGDGEASQETCKRPGRGGRPKAGEGGNSLTHLAMNAHQAPKHGAHAGAAARSRGVSTAPSTGGLCSWRADCTRHQRAGALPGSTWAFLNPPWSVTFPAVPRPAALGSAPRARLACWPPESRSWGREGRQVGHQAFQPTPAPYRDCQCPFRTKTKLEAYERPFPFCDSSENSSSPEVPSANQKL